MSSGGSSINIDLTFNQPQPTPPLPTDTSQVSTTSSTPNSQAASPIPLSPNPSSPQLSPQIQADIDQITAILQQVSSPSQDHPSSSILPHLPAAPIMDHDHHPAGYQPQLNPAVPPAQTFDASDPNHVLNLIQQQQAQIALLIQQLQNKTNTDMKLKVKVPLPDTFDGERTKCDSFLHQLHLVFRGDPANYKDEEARIILALSLMRSKTAGLWAERKLEQHEAYAKWLKSSDVDNEPNKAFYGWIDFVQQFKDQFGDPDPQLTAQIKLEGIVQSSRTCDEYATEFETYRSRTGFNDEAAIRLYK
jgi:Retrotransposon gag protein